MTDGIRTLVALDRGVEYEPVRNALPGAPTIELVGVVEGLEESARVLEESLADLIVVACSGYSDRALLFIRSAVQAHPDRPVVVLSERSPNGFLGRLFEAGADDVVMLPDSTERVAFAFSKAMARRAQSGAQTTPSARMVCVLGPKGGTGKTFTSTNLAVALAKEGKKVALVDLDLQFGDDALALGLEPEKTIYDLIRAGGSLDEEKLDDYLATHESGARVLIAPVRPDEAGFVTVDFLREVYAHLRAMHDVVIVDSPPGFSAEVIASIDSASDVCIVGMLDSLSLKNMKLGLETLERMGYESRRVAIVLNRADSRVGITHDDVEAIIGRPPDVLIPSDRQVPRSMTEGVPIVTSHANSEIGKAFKTLAAIYMTTEAPPSTEPQEPEKKKRRGLLLARGN
jgi:pilus assembly protein CpaE